MEEGDLNEDMETENQDLEEMEEMSTSEEEEEGENDETDEEVSDGNIGKQVGWDLSHLSEKEKEKEDERMKDDLAYDLAPGINIHVPNDEFNPTPSIQPQKPHKEKKKNVAIREPRRSARPRAGPPARFKD
jgi:hypothetical protein